MQLNNVHIMNAGEAVSINTENGKITGIQQHPFANAAAEINFENAFAIPGLINSTSTAFHPLVIKNIIVTGSGAITFTRILKKKLMTFCVCREGSALCGACTKTCWRALRQ